MVKGEEEEDAVSQTGKENTEPINPQISSKKNSSTENKQMSEPIGMKIAAGVFSLPLLPITPELPLKGENPPEVRKKSPVRFPTLLIPNQDKVSQSRPTVAGILFLPSIL
ncbi:uncharacterized protein LOC129221469 [Uloborus diversus]|uniref:uncharacterized protein LOC129221469 n=1 Tax=Uloborus diversus TaxID=327109 RepID=UPI0024099CFB|nr:uncharacterized protein LOC129221469 [Uloborus diversus]XP_054711925.1 uncharacterized protein LOC129221469 [Uloborus diversus]